jgi:hypothetical protein
MAADGPLRVVFAEDNYLVRAGTAALIAEVDEIDLVRLVDDPSSPAVCGNAAGRPPIRRGSARSWWPPHPGKSELTSTVVIATSSCTRPDGARLSLASRPVDAKHAEHMRPLGLVADVEGDVTARRT